MRSHVKMNVTVDFPVGILRAVGASGQANYICGSASAPHTRNFHRLQTLFRPISEEFSACVGGKFREEALEKPSERGR